MLKACALAAVVLSGRSDTSRSSRSRAPENRVAATPGQQSSTYAAARQSAASSSGSSACKRAQRPCCSRATGTPSRRRARK